MGGALWFPGERGNDGMWERPLRFPGGKQGNGGSGRGHSGSWARGMGHSGSLGNEGKGDGPLWFPGGSREMRVCGTNWEDGCSTHVHVTPCPFQETLPLYKRLEKRLELMNEYVQVTAKMNQAATSLNLSGGQDVLYTDLYNMLVHIKEDFDSKHRHWCTILNSRAE